VATLLAEGGPVAARPAAAVALDASSEFERPFVDLDRLAAPDVSGRLWADAD
jgi:hypothetical protein